VSRKDIVDFGWLKVSLFGHGSPSPEQKKSM
jgi:hypothetical protein